VPLLLSCRALLNFAFSTDGADIVVGWVDNDGQVHVADRFATMMARPNKVLMCGLCLLMW